MFRTLASRIAQLQALRSTGVHMRATILLSGVNSSHYVYSPPSLMYRAISLSSVIRSSDKESRAFGNESSEQTQVPETSLLDDDKLAEARKEVADLRTVGWQAPENISDFDVEHFMSLTTKSGRKKFLRFLAKKEFMKRNEKLKKEERARQRAERKALEEEDEDDGLPNRFLLRVQGNTMLQFDKHRLAAGMMFGPKIAFDFSYEELMRRQEVSSLVQQLLHVLSANKLAKDPFDIHWVGLTEETQSKKRLRTVMGDSFENVMVNETEQDLLEVFPRDKLIYLSADSPNVLKSFDSDRVHVVGALVDRSIVLTGQSLARAKRHGIEHAHLPLDKHLHWETGAKNLTLDQMVKILLELNMSGDWVKALQHVPIRKHAGLRSGPHWEPKEDSRPSQRKHRQDSIQRNPSHFVSSRAKKTKVSDRQRFKSTRNTNREDDDDTDSTLFSPKAKGWFESE